jgi:hypothetical protein
MRWNWRKLSIDPGLLMLAMGWSVCRIYHMRWTMLVLSFAPTAKPGPVPLWDAYPYWSLNVCLRAEHHFCVHATTIRYPGRRRVIPWPSFRLPEDSVSTVSSKNPYPSQYECT